MRFSFDKNKSEQLRNNPKQGIGFEEAIGWVGGKLYSIIYEVREDEMGEYIHLVTLWKSTPQEEKLYEESR